MRTSHAADAHNAVASLVMMYTGILEDAARVLALSQQQTHAKEQELVVLREQLRVAQANIQRGQQANEALVGQLKDARRAAEIPRTRLTRIAKTPYCQFPGCGRPVTGRQQYCGKVCRVKTASAIRTARRVASKALRGA